MNRLKKGIILLCTLLCNFFVFSQGYTVSPTVPDFTDITASWVVATYGSASFPFATTGITPGRHTVITDPGTDPNTGGALSLQPAGTSKVVKLGNSIFYATGESITYHFKVDPDNLLLLIKFALVLQDPGHEVKEQPRFVIRIMNADGNVIEPCTEYDVSARPGMEGFQDYDRAGTPIRWRDWTNVGLDLSAYAGKEIQVQFITQGCTYSEHFAYAYFTASCVSNKLALDACNGNQVTLSAPDGFASYLWNSGKKTASIEQTTGTEDMNISCLITSATGCQFTLSGYLSANNDIPEGDYTIYDTVCEGDAYNKNNYQLPPQTKVGTIIYYNTFFDINHCNNKGVSTLFLTVLQRNTSIVTGICEGENYKENGFSYFQPSPGTYYDTLRYPAMTGCDITATLKLTVYPKSETPSRIIGETHPCFGSMQKYTLSDINASRNYNWEFPYGFYIVQGEHAGEISVLVTDKAKAGPIILSDPNGCSVGNIPFDIAPSPAYWQLYTDTICGQTEYHQHGFHIPAYDTTGFYEANQYYKTTSGCDSITTLNLFIFKNPSIQIMANDSVICGNTTVNLHALGAGADKPDNSTTPGITVGDILCTDGSTVKPGDYPASGKAADAIIFWVNESGKHGWAVGLHGTTCQWARSNSNSTGLPNCDEGTSDTAGYNNTTIIRAGGNAADFPAAYLIDFANGWYIPAGGQLNILFAVIPEINYTLNIVGGTRYYGPAWSSTLFRPANIWMMDINGRHVPKNLTTSNPLRPIRNF